MASDDDLGERLRRLGFRVPKDALAAFLIHLHKSRVGPTETLEQLADLEDRARDSVNLARRTRFACLGTYKTLDRFDWTHPRVIDRALVERLAQLDFVERLRRSSELTHPCSPEVTPAADPDRRRERAA